MDSHDVTKLTAVENLARETAATLADVLDNLDEKFKEIDGKLEELLAFINLVRQGVVELKDATSEALEIVDNNINTVVDFVNTQDTRIADIETWIGKQTAGE